MYIRYLTEQIVSALADTPVVLVQGPRQGGKSTLVRRFAGGTRPAEYISLDDASTLATASRDPQGFIDRFDRPVILDEIQRVPELLLAIKRSVDNHRVPGRFLLTGSAEVLLLPRVADSLAGRLDLVTLWPLSQGEILGKRETLIDRLFGSFEPGTPPRTAASEIWQKVLRGGLPEPLARTDADRRSSWYESYLATMLQRDVRDLAAIEGLVDLPRLLGLLATRAGGIVNYSELARDSVMPLTTLRRYLAVLERIFLVFRLLPWSSNLGKRLVKAPKVFLNDSGLAAHLLGAVEGDGGAPPREAGRLLETFVVTELLKAQGWSRTRPALYHFRSHAQEEVDLVLEARGGDVVGIEIKAASSVGERDFRGLRFLQQALGSRFRRGAVLYLGETVLPFGKDLWALPVQLLWSQP